MRINLKFLKRFFVFELSVIKRATHWTKGILNRTKDGYYVCFIDYDLMKENYLKGELQRLQEVFNLGDIHLLQSSKKSFHAISFAKLTALEYIEVLENSSCDQAFKNVPRFSSYRNWVLRYASKGNSSNKPATKYLYTLKSKTNRVLSTAHHDLYCAMFPHIKKNQSRNSEFDGIYELGHIDYPTAKV